MKTPSPYSASSSSRAWKAPPDLLPRRAWPPGSCLQATSSGGAFQARELEEGGIRGWGLHIFTYVSLFSFAFTTEVRPCEIYYKPGWREMSILFSSRAEWLRPVRGRHSSVCAANCSRAVPLLLPSSFSRQTGMPTSWLAPFRSGNGSERLGIGVIQACYRRDCPMFIHDSPLMYPSCTLDVPFFGPYLHLLLVPSGCSPAFRSAECAAFHLRD